MQELKTVEGLTGLGPQGVHADSFLLASERRHPAGEEPRFIMHVNLW